VFASSISAGCGRGPGDALARRLGAETNKIKWPENERGRLPSTTPPQHLDVNLNTSGNFNDPNVNKKSLSFIAVARPWLHTTPTALIPAAL
jgi:hypothetical protein